MKIKNKIKRIITLIITITLSSFLFIEHINAKDLSSTKVYDAWGKDLNDLYSVIDTGNNLNVSFTTKSNGTTDIKITCKSEKTPYQLKGDKDYNTKWSDYKFALCFGVKNNYSLTHKKDGDEYHGFYAADPVYTQFAGKYYAWNYEGTQPIRYTNFYNAGSVVTKTVSEVKTGDAGTTSCEIGNAEKYPKLTTRVTIPKKTTSNGSYYDNLCWTYPLGYGTADKNKKADTDNGNYVAKCGLEIIFNIKTDLISEWQNERGYKEITVVMCKEEPKRANYIAAGCGVHDQGWRDNNTVNGQDHYLPHGICSGERGKVSVSCYHGKNHKHVNQDFCECGVIKYWPGSIDIFAYRDLTTNFSSDNVEKVTYTANNIPKDSPINTTQTAQTFTESYKVGTEVTISAIIKPGYYFTQFQNQKGGSESDTTGIIADQQSDNSYILTKKVKVGNDKTFAIYADPIKYYVQYNKNATDATGTMAKSLYAYNEEKALSKNQYKRTGYTFTNWQKKGSTNTYTDEQKVKGLTTNSWDNNVNDWSTVELDAKWKANTYNITYTYNAPLKSDGTSRESEIKEYLKDKKQPTSATYDQWFEVSIPKLKGYTSKGWQISGLSKEIKKYAGTSQQNYINFAPNLAGDIYLYNDTSVTNDSRFFKNLNTGEDKNYKTVNFACYGGWKPIYYSIKLDGNGGLFDVPTSPYAHDLYTKFINYDETYTLPAAKRDGYVFKGWQVYEIVGDSDYTSRINTNTNPLNNNAYRYKAGDVVENLCYEQDAKITLVAIWEHAHSVPEINDLVINDASGYIYKDDVDPTGKTNSCYYINTNQINDIVFNTNIKAFGSLSWYNIDKYRVKLESDETQTDIFTTEDMTRTEFTPGQVGEFTGVIKSKEDLKIHLEGNAYKTCSPEVIMKCTWEDNYTKCTCDQSLLTFNGNSITVVGDKDIPTIENLEKLTDLTAIDLEEVSEYIVKLIGRDDGGLNNSESTSKYPSGLVELCYFKVSNLDNSLKVNAGTGLKKTNYRMYNNAGASDGLIYHIDFEEFDLAGINFDAEMEADSVEDMFMGDIKIEYYLQDNVGNIYTNTDITSVFDLDTTLKSFTYDPTNYESATIHDEHNGTMIGNIPVFKKGEAAILTVDTTGYVNGLKIEFPESWYISDKYPLYMYWGDQTKYTDKSLEKITAPVFYLNTEGFSDNKGYWSQDFIFILPLYAEKTNLEDIKITAYKGADRVTDPDIQINHNAGANLESLSATEYFKVNDKSILNDFRDSIKYTY